MTTTPTSESCMLDTAHHLELFLGLRLGGLLQGLPYGCLNFKEFTFPRANTGKGFSKPHARILLNRRLQFRVGVLHHVRHTWISIPLLLGDVLLQLLQCLEKHFHGPPAFVHT